MKLASHIQIPPSATLAMNALAAAKKKQGKTVYNLTVGEPVIETPRLIKEAAYKALQEGKTLYPPVLGIPDLREAAALWMRQNYGSTFQKENTIVTCGGKHGLMLTLQALLEAGDEVLLVAPYWVSYPSMVSLAGGQSRILETSEENNWKIQASDIAKACNSKTKLLMLNNGGNPSGVLYNKEEIKDILQVAKEKNLIVISDEVYSGLTYDAEKFVSVSEFPEYVSNTIVIQSCSKHFAMTGWRVGFVFGPPNLIEMLETLQSQSTTGTSSISQWAALSAIENAEKIIPEIKTEMQKRRDAFIENFEKYFGKKISRVQAGLYAFIPMSHFGIQETDSVNWCMKILEEANVVFVPGTPFGVDGYVRASFGGKIEDGEAALKHLCDYLKKESF